MKLMPHIELIPHPVNCKIDDIEDTDVTELYNVIVSQNNLKMLFLVERNNPYSNYKNREYETIKCEYISLHGIDKKDEYLQQVDDISLSADHTIVNNIFKTSLEPFKLKLLKNLVFHNFEFFEAKVEGVDFVFEDENIYNKLKDLINIKCLKMIKNSNLFN